MARIRIEDLPPDTDLTPEELERIYGGAGRRPFRPTLEGLENREVYAAQLSSALTPGVLALGNVTPGNAQVQTITPRSEVPVEGGGAIGAASLTGSAGPAASNPALIDALLGAGGFGGPAAPASRSGVTGSTNTPASTVDLSGKWYFNGQECTIIQSGNNLTFINERGERSQGFLLANGQVIAIGWNNLMGTLSQDNTRITWANGSVWDRQQINLSGKWLINGRPCTIIQSGNDLTFINEKGQRSEGFLLANGQVVATGWNNLMGTLSHNNTRITWANGSVWNRVP